MNQYKIPLICSVGRCTQRVIAQNAMRATQIALNVLPEASQFTVICKLETITCAA